MGARGILLPHHILTPSGKQSQGSITELEGPSQGPGGTTDHIPSVPTLVSFSQTSDKEQNLC